MDRSVIVERGERHRAPADEELVDLILGHANLRALIDSHSTPYWISLISSGATGQSALVRASAGARGPSGPTTWSTRSRGTTSSVASHGSPSSSRRARASQSGPGSTRPTPATTQTGVPAC